MVAKKFAVLKKERERERSTTSLGLGQGHLLSPLIDIALQKKLLDADIVSSDRENRTELTGDGKTRRKKRVEPVDWHSPRGLTALDESARRARRELGRLFIPIVRTIVPEELDTGLDVSLSPHDRNTTVARRVG
jgi:hypothetical protein